MLADTAAIYIEAGNGGNGIPAGDGGLFLRAGGLPGRDGVRGRISGRRSGIPRIRRI